MGLILLPLYGGYIFLSVVIGMAVFRNTKSKVFTSLVFCILLFIPTYDIVISNLLGKYYCLTDSEPQTFIKEKIDSPESIYWEDNVYPGFNKVDRKWMIENYLDGIHLKKIALNSPDGKVYEYEYMDVNQSYVNLVDAYTDAREETIQLRINLKAISKQRELYPLKYKKAIEEKNLASQIERKLSQEITITKKALKLRETIVENKKDMSFYHYTVRSERQKLSSFKKHFIYRSRTDIINNKLNTTIAYRKSLSSRSYMISLSSAGRSFFGSSLCEKFRTPLDDVVFPKIKRYNVLNHKRSLSSKSLEEEKKGN